MTSRNLPAALAPRTPAKPAEPVVLYIAVPDERFLKALRHTRLFSSARDGRPVELRAFMAPDLPNLPFEDLRLLGTLTEFGTVADLPLTILKSEKLP